MESRQAKYYLMETHYINLEPDLAQVPTRQMADNSGLKIHFTHVLRHYEAGVISIGMFYKITTTVTQIINVLLSLQQSNKITKSKN